MTSLYSLYDVKNSAPLNSLWPRTLKTLVDVFTEATDISPVLINLNADCDIECYLIGTVGKMRLCTLNVLLNPTESGITDIAFLRKGEEKTELTSRSGDVLDTKTITTLLIGSISKDDQNACINTK